MTIKTYKRSELRDIMDKRERAATKLGQEAAKRYLRSKEAPPARGNIRAALAFTVAIGVVNLILFAL
jgi:hypothetical protein